ncbi:hypothetical protein [Catellatospora bangladeshensis]
MLDTDNPAAPAGAAFPPADRIATALAAALVAASITAGAALNLLGTPVQAQAAPCTRYGGRTWVPAHPPRWPSPPP